MAHEDAGHYAAKHPQGTELNAAIGAEIEKKAQKNALSCAAAHTIAKTLGTAPAEVGRNMDLLEIRLTKCQLGLFGYTPDKKIVTPAESVASELEAALLAVAAGGRLSCESAWRVAAAQGLKRMDLSAACEALKLKVKPCQLGAF